MKLLVLLAALAVDNATLFAGLEASAGWVEVDRKSLDDLEVVVRHKVVSGQDCLEGTTHAALNADRLLDAAADIESQPSWSSFDMPYAKRLSPGRDVFDYVQVLDNPKPVADRYWFTRGMRVLRGQTRMFRWEGLDGAATWPTEHAALLQRFPDAVSATVNIGDWSFTPQTGTTEVRYRICTDAGGSLPKWVGEFAARTTLPTNLADIVKRVRALGG